MSLSDRLWQSLAWLAQWLVRLLSWIFRSATLVGVVLLVVAASFYGFVQTEYGKAFLKNKLQALFSEQFNGRLEFNELRMDFPNEVTIDQVKLYVGCDTLPSLSLRQLQLELDADVLYDGVLKGFSDRIHFRRLVLSQPTLHVEEDSTGTFTLLRLIRADTTAVPDTTETTIPNLIFDEIAVDQAHIVWNRLLAKPAEHDTLRYDKWEVINAKLLAYFEYRNEVFTLILRSLHFELPKKNFLLESASGFLALNRERVELLGWRVQTRESGLACNASLSGLNVFEPITKEAIEKTRFAIELDVPRAVPKEFEMLLPEVPLPEGEFSALILARGWLNNFTLSPSYLQTPQSRISLSGEVVGIATLENLWVNLTVRDSQLSIPELYELLRIEELKDYRSLGTVEVEGTYRGTRENFKADAELRSIAGNLRANLELSFRQGFPITYIGGIETERLNLALALGDSSLQSNINFKGEVNGKGTEWQRLRGIEFQLSGRLEPSVVARREISSAVLNIRAARQKAEGELKVAAGEQSLHFTGELDFKPAEPTYKGRARLEGFDLSKWIEDDSVHTHLTMTCELDGESFSLDKVSGRFHIMFDSSTVGRLYIQSGTTASLDVQQSDSLAAVRLESDVANFEAEGKFNLSTLLTLLMLQSAVISEEILKDNIFRSEAQQRRYEYLMRRTDRLTKTLQRKAHRSEGEAELSSITDSMLVLPTLDVRYKLRFKSLSNLALMMRSGYFNAIGTMEGHIESEANRCTWQTSLTIDSLRYGSLLAARTLTASLRYSDELRTDSTQQRTFHTINALLQGSVFRMKVGDQRFVKTALRAKYTPSDLDINLRTTNQNTRGLFDLDAEVRVVSDQYVVQLRDATFATQNYFWQNDANAQIIIGRELVRFENLRFINNEQEIAVLGEFRLTGQSELALQVQDFSLSDIRQFLFESPNTQLSGTLNLTMNLTGNFASPVILLTSTLDNFAYETVDIGHLELVGRYDNKQLSFELSANTDTARYRAFNLPLKPYTHIRGEGRIPIDLSLGAEERLLRNEEVWVEIVCPNLSPTILEFAAPVQRVSGALGIRATYSGRFPNPVFRAVLTAQDVRATTTTSSVEYVINGSAEITPTLVQWRSVDVRDRQGGVLRTSGTVQMSSFDVQRFDIRLSFAKLLLYDKQAGRSEELIGRLIASSDELRFSGTLEEPMLSGTLRLDGGRLTQFRSGSSKGSQIVEASKFITTIVEEDTSLEARLRRNPKLNLTLDEEFELSETARAIRSAYKASLVDEMSMSLRITTVQPLFYTLVFDRFLGEQLENAIIEDLALTLNKRRTTYRVFGSASITAGRYSFYGVAFDIEPGATMRWLGGGLTDATLDIFARHTVRVMSRTRNELDNIVLRPHIGGTVEDTRIDISYILNERTYRAPGANVTGEEDPNAALNFIMLLTARQWYAPPGSATNAALSSSMLAGAGLSAGAGLLSTQITRIASVIQGVQTVSIDFARDRSGQVAGVDFSLEYAVPGTDGRLVLSGAGSTAAVDSLGRSNNAISNSQRLEYRISRNLVLEAFRSYGPNNFNLFNNNIAEVWGIGISYRETFHTWGEFGARWNSYFDAFARWLSGSKVHSEEKKPNAESSAVSNATSRITMPSSPPTPMLQDTSRATPQKSDADSTAKPIAVPAPAIDTTAVSRRRMR